MKLLNHKRAIELPTTMVVILILSIVVFSFSIVMVFKFFRGATEASSQIDRQTQDQITAILRESNDLVALPANYATARIGQQLTFGIGIRNIHNQNNFHIVLGFDNAYTPLDEQLPGVIPEIIENQWLGNFKQQTITIKKDEFTMTPLILRVGNNINAHQQTEPGIYVFNACVFEGQAKECLLGNILSTYDQKIRQISIKTT